MRLSTSADREWLDAEARRERLQIRAREGYPESEGYIHDFATDGWPDCCGVMRIYQKVSDKRCRHGFRLDYAATLLEA